MEMKMNCGFEGDGDKGMYLPPGFRFHPTDEELITHYLIPKAMDSNFMARAMGEVDLNKCEPWDLPKKAKIGEKEWYFFTIRDRKYPTGMRTNRATKAGYWKATGKDKEIYNKQKSLVGMKKTLVFYKGRAPKGQKSNWVMHEYRLHGNLLTTSKNEWVICRVFHKSSGAKKSPFPSLVKSDSCQNEFMPNGLPPLMEPSPYSSIDDRGGEGGSGQTIPRPLNMSCSSNLNIAMGLSSHETFNSFINYHAFGAPNPIPTYPNPNGPLRGSYMSGSQDTGLSNEMNGENSSVISNYEIGRQSFDHDPKARLPLAGQLT